MILSQQILQKINQSNYLILSVLVGLFAFSDVADSIPTIATQQVEQLASKPETCTRSAIFSFLLQSPIASASPFRNETIYSIAYQIRLSKSIFNPQVKESPTPSRSIYSPRRTVVVPPLG